MRLGLIRHFPVRHGLPTGWRTSAELMAWRDHYNRSEVVVGPAHLGDEAWVACVSSDLHRARVTAAAVFSGRVEETPLLREAEFAPFPTGDLRLPVWAWHWVLRLSWMSGHPSQRACRDEFRRRVRVAADRLMAVEQDTLVVSHAGMMAFLSAELRRRGLTGPRLRIPRHATVYTYRRG